MTASVQLYGDPGPRVLPADFDLDALIKAISVGDLTTQFQVQKSPRRSWRFTAGDVVKIRATGVDYSGLDAPKQWQVAA